MLLLCILLKGYYYVYYWKATIMYTIMYTHMMWVKPYRNGLGAESVIVLWEQNYSAPFSPSHSLNTITQISNMLIVHVVLLVNYCWCCWSCGHTVIMPTGDSQLSWLVWKYGCVIVRVHKIYIGIAGRLHPLGISQHIDHTPHCARNAPDPSPLHVILSTVFPLACNPQHSK